MEEGREMVEFFAGVAEARAFLDAQARTPERRRARLAGIARELLRPRSTVELLRWFAASLADALSAEGWQAWMHQERWELIASSGTTNGATAATFDVLEPSKPWKIDTQSLTLGLQGTVATHGGVWVGGTQTLDAETERILMAMAGTVGMLLEQSQQAPVSDLQS